MSPHNTFLLCTDAATEMGQRNNNGALQADGSIQHEPLMSVDHVGSSIAYMASLPLHVSVLSHTMWVFLA